MARAGDDVIRSGRRPRKHDPLEFASFYCDGINAGKTAGVIALETAALRSDRAGIKRTRRANADIKQAVPKLVKAFQRAREELLLPWKPEIGKGIHRFEKSDKVRGFGVPIFMGRPLPQPVGLEPRVVVRRGRRKKPR